MERESRKWIWGEKRGFSLVELIIVIAIMAILVGIVSLAVIPYLEKTKETKDLSTLDSVCSALVTAVATSSNLEYTAQTFKYDGVTNPGVGTGKERVSESMNNSLGMGRTSLQSTRLKEEGASIYCCYDVSHNAVFVFAGTDDSTPVNFSMIRTGYQNDTVPPVTAADGKAAVASASGYK